MGIEFAIPLLLRNRIIRPPNCQRAHDIDMAVRSTIVCDHPNLLVRAPPPPLSQYQETPPKQPDMHTQSLLVLVTGALLLVNTALRVKNILRRIQ